MWAAYTMEDLFLLEMDKPSLAVVAYLSVWVAVLQVFEKMPPNSLQAVKEALRCTLGSVV